MGTVENTPSSDIIPVLGTLVVIKDLAFQWDFFSLINLLLSSLKAFSTSYAL